jgi:filamentous hemagglutinin
MGAAAGQTSSGRLKVLAAASAVLTAKDAAQDLAKNGPSARISLTVGHSESESTEVTASRTHGGSVLAAGSNVIISATGGGKASNIDIVGSDVRAAGKVSLAADNQVNLLAAQDSESQHSQSKSWSAAVGVAAELSSSSEFGYTASVSASRGNVDGEGSTQVNSHVSAGDRLTIASGGDTNLKGAVASGSQVVTDVKGNLNIESLQDMATLDGKRQSVSVSGTVGAGAGFSANLSQSKVHNEYASVQEQSGIRAGDGGFQLQIAGNTDLKGGVISSSEQAIKDERSSLDTATLSFSDIQNRDSHDASGVSLGVNVGKNQTGDPFSPSMAPGIGQVSGSQGSVTRSGVSGAALTVSDQQAGQAVANLNRDVSNGKDMAQALTKGWKGARALDEVGAQMQITSAAMPRLAAKIGDYAKDKVVELNKQDNAEEAAKWAEGGIYRVAAHTALGALGGGVGGAVGAAVSAEAAPTLSKLETAVKGKLAEAGLGSGAANVAAKLITGGAAAVIGGVAGGSSGAATGLNSEANNRQLHSAETTWIKKNATKFAEERGISVEEATKRLAQQASKDVDLVWRGALPDNEDKDAKAFLARAQGESFTNSFGQKQELFSTQDGQFTAAQNGLFEVDKAFVNKYVTPYANRTALEGVRTEIGQMANEVVETVKRDPLGVAKQAGISILTGAWETISHPVSAANALIDGTVSSAKSFGEGVGASINEDIQRQLNNLYGQDVTSAIQIATSAQGAVLLGSALGAGKAASKAVTAVGDAAITSNIKIKSFVGRGDVGGTAVDRVKIASNFSRDADMTTGLRPAEDVNKLFAEIGYDAPFTNGTYVNVSMSKPGASAYLVVSDSTGQAKAIDAGKPALGAFATPDPVPSQVYARETLAITSSMKMDVSRVVQVETSGKTMVQIEGKVAPQEPIRLYPGNGNQVFFDYPQGSVRTDYVKPLDPTQVLPAQNATIPTKTSAAPAAVLP